MGPFLSCLTFCFFLFGFIYPPTSLISDLCRFTQIRCHSCHHLNVLINHGAKPGTTVQYQVPGVDCTIRSFTLAVDTLEIRSTDGTLHSRLPHYFLSVFHRVTCPPHLAKPGVYLQVSLQSGRRGSPGFLPAQLHANSA